MAARREDALTQIQKYKAMLNSRRNKGDEKATRRPKKKRLRKGNGETAAEENALTVPGSTKETLNKFQAEDSNHENFDTTKLETSTESKQSPLSSTNDDDIVEPRSTITRTGGEEAKDKESELVDDSEPMKPIEPTCEEKAEQKKEKSKGLSLRRKKKSKKRKESAEKVAQPVKNEGEIEEDLEEKYSWKESAPDLPSTSPLSKETKQYDNLCVEASPEKNFEADENETTEEADGKEKMSRAKKFKRWARFGKGKKTSEAVDLDHSEPNSRSIQDPESLDDGPSERILIRQSLPGEKEEGVENSAKEEPVNEQEDLQSPPLPQEQRRRSASLDEPTDKENESLTLIKAQRTRSVSLGKADTIITLTSLPQEKPKGTFQAENVPVKQDGEKASSQKEDEIAELDKENNEDVNEVNNEQSFDNKETGDDKKEQQNTESPAKDDQPKKKKKSFLRKISSKNTKINKKDYETRETAKKPVISAPLLVKYESLTGSDVLTNSKPIEVSPDKPNKRKKSGLNIKLPKALKRPKANEYEMIGGVEAEKEIKRDEALQRNNVENSEVLEEEEEESREEESREEERRPDLPTLEKIRENAENEEIAGNGTGESKETNADDGEAHSICRALMKDVLGELLLHIEGKQYPSEEDGVQETNHTPTPTAEELANNEEHVKANDVIKEEELVHHVGESSRVPGQQMGGQETSQVTTTAEEEEEEEREHLEELSENGAEQEDKEDQLGKGKDDITVQKDEENEENREPKEQRVHQDIERSSDQTEETVQVSLQLQPKEPEKPEGEPNTTENQPETEDTTTSCEDEIKQPEEMPKATEEEPQKLKNNSHLEDEPKESEDNQVSERSAERSASEGTFNFYSNDVSALERSIEASMMTQALVDTYIFIDHSLQLSQDFLKQIEMMDLNYANRRGPRCSIM